MLYRIMTSFDGLLRLFWIGVFFKLVEECNDFGKGLVMIMKIFSHSLRLKSFCIGGLYLVVFVLLGVLLHHRQSQVSETVSQALPLPTSCTLYVGETSACISPFSYYLPGDERLLSLLYPRMLQQDKDGHWNDNICQIETTKNAPKKGLTTYTIRTKDPATISVQDLLFNLYVRCDPFYYGTDEIRQMKILGLNAYRFDTLEVTTAKKKLQKELTAPSLTTQRLLQKQIVIPALEREYAWTTSLYQTSTHQDLLKKYPSTNRLFAWLYAPVTTYTGKGKTKDQVIRTIARQYLCDLNRLTRATGDDYSATAYLLCHNFKQTKHTRNLKKIHGIRGIRQTGDNTIQVITKGYHPSDRKRLGSLFIVPFNSFGNKGMYQQKDRQYGYAFGKLDTILTKGTSLLPGNGAFSLTGYTDESFLLKKNHTKNADSQSISQIRILKGSLDVLSCRDLILQNRLDLAILWEKWNRQQTRLGRWLSTSPKCWQIGTAQAILYSTERINATTLFTDMTPTSDILPQVASLRCNPPD